MSTAIELARASGQPLLLMQVLTWNWAATFHPATLENRRAIAEEQLALARREHSSFFELFARAARCEGLLELGDLTGAEAEAAEIERIVGVRHDLFARPGILFRRAGIQFVHGDLRAAEATATELFTLAHDLAPTRPDAVLFYAPHFANLRFVQGRLDELLPIIAATAAEQPEIAAFQAVWAMMSARSGQPDEARRIIATLLAGGVETIAPNIGWYATVGALGDAAHVVGEVGAASSVAEALEPYAGRYVVQGGCVSQPIDVIRAELALTLGESAHAAAIAAGAAAHAESQGAPIFAAHALVLEAAAHHRLGQRVSAATALQRAIDVAERTGARLITLEAQRLGLI